MTERLNWTELIKWVFVWKYGFFTWTTHSVCQYGRGDIGEPNIEHNPHPLPDWYLPRDLWWALRQNIQDFDFLVDSYLEENRVQRRRRVYSVSPLLLFGSLWEWRGSEYMCFCYNAIYVCMSECIPISLCVCINLSIFVLCISVCVHIHVYLFMKLTFEHHKG